MKEIDYEGWSRREIFEFFSGVSNPFYMVTFTADVTGLRDWCRQRGLSFYLSMVYLATQAVNSVENMRYTMEAGRVCLLEARKPSFTDMRRGEELFHITTAELQPDLETFVRAAKRKSEAQTQFIALNEESEGLVYISSLPELRMTAMTNERELLSPAAADSNIPVLSWGKLQQNGGKEELSICIEVNHRFVDGIHITRFAQALEAGVRALTQGG